MSIFTFQRQAGAAKIDEWVRLYESLLADVDYISIGHNGDRLKSFLDVISQPGQPVGLIGGTAVNDVASWRTNCAMTQHAAMVWMGRVLRPYINAQPIQNSQGNSYLELAKGDRYWVTNDGVAVPTGICIFYLEPSRVLPFEHVGAFGLPLGPRHYRTYEGGGGDGTKIGKNDRFLDSTDSYSRHMSGWWQVDGLVPDFDAASGDNVTDNPGDEVIEKKDF